MTLKTKEHWSKRGEWHVLLVEWECEGCGASGLDENVCHDVEPGFCSITRCPECERLPLPTITDPFEDERAEALAYAKKAAGL